MNPHVTALIVGLAVLVAWDAIALYLTAEKRDAPPTGGTPALERALRMALCTGLLAWTATAGGST